MTSEPTGSGDHHRREAKMKSSVALAVGHEDNPPHEDGPPKGRETRGHGLHCTRSEPHHGVHQECTHTHEPPDRRKPSHVIPPVRLLARHRAARHPRRSRCELHDGPCPDAPHGVTPLFREETHVVQRSNSPAFSRARQDTRQCSSLLRSNGCWLMGADVVEQLRR